MKRSKNKQEKAIYQDYIAFKQKSKYDWILSRDEAVTFSYAKIPNRKFINNRKGNIYINGESYNDLKRFGDNAIKFFVQLINKHIARELPKITYRNIITDYGRNYLNDNVDIEGIHEAIYSVKDDTSPVPDGLMLNFSKYICRGWNIQF